MIFRTARDSARAPTPHVDEDPANARGLREPIRERLHSTLVVNRRGRVLRRALAIADLLGLSAAFVVSEITFGSAVGVEDSVGPQTELLFFLATLPAWLFVANQYRLYERDRVRADHSFADDIVGVFHLVTIGAWLLFAGAFITGFADPNLAKISLFWALAIVLVTAIRAIARALSHHSVAYLQNAVIIGAGHVGQLVARKLIQHPEYGINLVGFVDEQPRQLRPDVEGVPILASTDDLPRIVRQYDVDRVMVAFSTTSHEKTLRLVRKLIPLNVQVELVPRLFEVIDPAADLHSVEGLPLIRLSAGRLSRTSRIVKRAIDLVGASLALIVTAPLFAAIAFKIKRETSGPVFFRQTRLSEGMAEFTNLKFRTMHVGSGSEVHRNYIGATMSASETPEASGLYKLDRMNDVTPVGEWLRRTSLDELPQLINVLRGDLSLVGPRPCIPYEVEFFESHHFDRFLVPAGITGLWQVTARARSTFGEALELDVAYVHSYSLWLDLQILLRTPVQLFRQRVTA